MDILVVMAVYSADKHYVCITLQGKTLYDQAKFQYDFFIYPAVVTRCIR